LAPEGRSARPDLVHVHATSLKQCRMELDGADSVDTKALEKLFLSLA